MQTTLKSPDSPEDERASAVMCEIDLRKNTIYTATLGRCTATIFRMIDGKPRAIPLSPPYPGRDCELTYDPTNYATPYITMAPLCSRDVVVITTSELRKTCSVEEIAKSVLRPKDPGHCTPFPYYSFYDGLPGGRGEAIVLKVV